MNTAQLKKQYAEQIAPALEKQFNYSSKMQVPVLKKIVVNQGLGDATQDKKNQNGKYPAPHKVLKVLVKEQRAIVEGVNMVSKSTKPSAKNPQGGIVKQEAPIHISNLALVDPKTGEPTRVAIKKTDDGKKVRVAKKSGEEIK